MRARPTTVLAVVAALVVALAVVAAVVSAGRETPALDAATPEGVVQLYLRALFNDDVDTAVSYLDPALGCSEPAPEPYLPDVSRIAVIQSTTTGDTAAVEVRMEEGSGLWGTWSHDERFSLRRAEPSWLITGEPWPLYQCE